jgi:hypothetical protein
MYDCNTHPQRLTNWAVIIVLYVVALCTPRPEERPVELDDVGKVGTGLEVEFVNVLRGGYERDSKR